MARYGSAEIALRYAVIIIAGLQLCSIFVAKKIIQQGKKLSPQDMPVNMKVIHEVTQVAL
jgi:YQGE family putative transporter